MNSVRGSSKRTLSIYWRPTLPLISPLQWTLQNWSSSQDRSGSERDCPSTCWLTRKPSSALRMPSLTTPRSVLTTTTNTPSGSSLWQRNTASPMCVSALSLISFPSKSPMLATTLTLPSLSPTKRMCALKSDLSTCIWSTNRRIERTTRWIGRRT